MQSQPLQIEVGAYTRNDGSEARIMGRTKDGLYWWSLAGDWYDDQGRFVAFRREAGLTNKEGEVRFTVETSWRNICKPIDSQQ
jgi:hypothetical protein